MIPNKAFQALACGAPLVTADTPAARELLDGRESALLVPPGDAEALAARSGGSRQIPSSRAESPRADAAHTSEQASEDGARRSAGAG